MCVCLCLCLCTAVLGAAGDERCQALGLQGGLRLGVQLGTGTGRTQPCHAAPAPRLAWGAQDVSFAGKVWLESSQGARAPCSMRSALCLACRRRGRRKGEGPAKAVELRLPGGDGVPGRVSVNCSKWGQRGPRGSCPETEYSTSYTPPSSSLHRRVRHS